MGEYQYYEFQAIDCPLTVAQMRELRAISTRATISRTLFSNYYTYGALKANPRNLLARYFEASLYFAHWHVVEVAFRFARRAIDLRRLRRYRTGASLDVRTLGPDVIITVSAEREDFDAEDDGRGWLSSLIPLRADLASGDERVLYLAWLLGVQHGEIDERATEPSRPDGLGTLSPALDTFVEIMGVDRDLVAAAAEGASRTSPAPSAKAFDGWIATLGAREHVMLLSRVARGEPGVGSELLRRFRRQQAPGPSTDRLRTAGALLDRARARAEQRQRIVIARETQEHERRERVQAAAHERQLARLATRQPDAWRRVESLIATKQPADYDAAVTLLQDLREIARRAGRSADIATRIRALRKMHAKKVSLLARLRKAKL